MCYIFEKKKQNRYATSKLVKYFSQKSIWRYFFQLFLYFTLFYGETKLNRGQGRTHQHYKVNDRKLT